MILFFWLLFGYYVAMGLFLIVLIGYFVTRKEVSNPAAAFRPKVSVLLAFRNESANVNSCLESIARLDYPSELLEVWIGDDQSEDDTYEKVEAFIQGKSNYHLLRITKKLGLAGAKGNVLAHLAHLAKGDFFFITDADVTVPRTWIKGLLRAWNPQIATVSGSAIIGGKDFFSKMQSIDWISAFGMIFTASRSGIPVTAVGNNMMVYRLAYFQAGGYENIPFSVTEDFDLHEEVRKLGWGNVNMLDDQILSTTKAIPGFLKMMQQRKRWMSGAVRLPKILVLLLTLQALFFPVTLLALIFFPVLGWISWLLKFILQNIFLYLVLKKVRAGYSLMRLSLLYELYAGISAFAVIIFYFLPLNTIWKGRKYE